MHIEMRKNTVCSHYQHSFLTPYTVKNIRVNSVATKTDVRKHHKYVAVMKYWCKEMPAVMKHWGKETSTETGVKKYQFWRQISSHNLRCKVTSRLL